MSMTIQSCVKDKILVAQGEASKVENMPAKMLCGLDQQMEKKEDGGLYFMDRIRVPIVGDVKKMIMDEAHATRLIGPELVQETTNRVVLIKERLKAAEDCQKSYADNRHNPLEFEVGPSKILKRIDPVAYRFRLPQELSNVHDTFHMSNLKKCLADANLHVLLEEIKSSQIAYLLIYVDDIILTASSLVLLQHIIDSLHNEFEMTDLGVLNYFLVSLLLVLLQTLINTESKMGLEGIHVQDPTLYRSLAEGLQYLTFTHPNLSYAWTMDFGLQLYISATTSLVGYTDADCAGCPSTCRSTSGYYVFLGDNLLSWLAKRQHTLSRSNAKDEYRGVANVVAETAWLLNLLHKLHSPPSTATLVYCNKVSFVYMSANPVQHQWMKHIEIDIHFVPDMVTAGQVKVLHVPSRYQYADIFTKGLPLALYFDPRMNQGINYPSIVHYLRFFATKFPAIVYNDALASKSDLSSEPTVSPQHVDEISLKNESSLSEYDDVKYNVISYNDLFPFNIFFVDDSKLDTDNDNDNIDIKQYSMDIFIEPLPNVISTDIGTYAQGSNILWETSHDTISKIFTTETFIKELCVNIVT
ncbi:ribonuclease H-like domain-containing protein [Tanacetum coccineum]